MALHCLGILCGVGRVMHAINMCWKGPHMCRVIGMGLTVAALVFEAAALLKQAL